MKKSLLALSGVLCAAAMLSVGCKKEQVYYMVRDDSCVTYVVLRHDCN